MLSLYLMMIDNDEDKSKFETVYINYKNIMLNRAYEILGDRELAEDAVHNAFLKLIKNLSKISDTDSDRTKWYLVIIAENEAKNIYVKEHKVMKSEFDEIKSDFNVEKLVEDKNAVQAVKNQIDSLPDIYRQILLLRFYNGMEVKELAKSLSISVDTAYKRIQRGIKLLLTKVEGDYSD